jgi:hypothetical protein
MSRTRTLLDNFGNLLVVNQDTLNAAFGGLSMNNDHRCTGRTKSGQPCRAAATEGGLCFFHANPNKAVELGRLGGRKNRHHLAGPGDGLPAMNSLADVRKTIDQIIAEVHSGKLQPKIAGALVPFLALRLRVIEGEHQLRIREREQLSNLTPEQLPEVLDNLVRRLKEAIGEESLDAD